MPFEFHEASCVIVGTFNIYIIRPDWLGEVGLLPKGSQVRIETQLDRPGLRLTSPNLGATWVVLPERLVLETQSGDEDCGATVDRILERLPWTPLRAVGCNVNYRGNASDIDGWETLTGFPPATPPEGFERDRRTWHVGLRRDEQTYNLQMSQHDEGVEIHANVHTELQDRSVGFAREVARRFFQFREVSLTLIRELFHARVEDGIGNG